MSTEMPQHWLEAVSPVEGEAAYEITDIEGEIPRELHGTLYRNGPSQKVLPAGGRIVVSTALGPRGEVRIGIRDNGPGIPPEEREKIFRIFFSTKGGKGTGLGLSVIKKITEEHGGVLRIKSELEKGSAFHIHLPKTTVQLQ